MQLRQYTDWRQLYGQRHGCQRQSLHRRVRRTGKKRSDIVSTQAGRQPKISNARLTQTSPVSEKAGKPTLRITAKQAPWETTVPKVKYIYMKRCGTTISFRSGTISRYQPMGGIWFWQASELVTAAFFFSSFLAAIDARTDDGMYVCQWSAISILSGPLDSSATALAERRKYVRVYEPETRPSQDWSRSPRQPRWR